MSGPLHVQAKRPWHDAGGDELDSPQAAAIAVSHSTDDRSDDSIDDGDISHSVEHVSAYKRLLVRYTALRRAYRRQESELEALNAAHVQSCSQALGEREKEQRATQQLPRLLDQLARVQCDYSQLAAREQQWSARGEQLLAERRAAESAAATCREQHSQLEAELERQSGAVQAERKRLIAAVSRHVRDESAQQSAVQALTQTVESLTAEVASREAEREQLLIEAQRLRDAVQILQARQQQAPLESANNNASDKDSATDALAAPPERLFLSPLQVASPCVDSTPSTSTCDALRFSAPPAVPRSAVAAVSRAGSSSSPLASQLLHATTALPSPEHDAAFGSREGSSSRSGLRVSSHADSSSDLSAFTASCVAPISPFSATEFPPLPSSPAAVPPTPPSVWNGTAQRIANIQTDRALPRQGAETVTTAARDAPNSRSSSGNSLVQAGLPSVARSLHFPTSDDDDSTSVPTQLLAVVDGAASDTTALNTCSPAGCSHCPQAAPPSSILPLTFDTPVGARFVVISKPESLALTAVADAPTPVRMLPSSTPCSSCQLRACSALLTPITSSQRSLAVLDSEFRRVKRWTTQLQRSIAQHQQHQQPRRPSPTPPALTMYPNSATFHPRPSHRSAVTRQRANSAPHPPPPDRFIAMANSHTKRTLAANAPNTSPLPNSHLLAAIVSPASALEPLAVAVPEPLAVSVSSLLVQLSLCESELEAKDSSLQAAALHIAALHDKLSVMADSVEQLEAEVEHHKQHWLEQQQHTSRAAEETDRERRSWSQELQASAERGTASAEQCAALHSQLDEARCEAAQEHSRHVQRSAEWEQRCSALVHRVAALQAVAELHAAQLDSAQAALQQCKQSDASLAERLCGIDNESDAGQAVQLIKSDTDSGSPPPLLHLVEQQFCDELSELKQLLLHFEPYRE